MLSHYSKEDLLMIRRPLLATLVVVLAGLALYGGAFWFYKEQERALLEVGAARDRAAFLHQNAVEEEETIRDYLDRYRGLAADGVMSGEDRLDLIEQIAGIRKTYRLYPVQVEIEPQLTRLGAGAEEEAAGPSFRVSPIRLSLPLLHEGDLFRLLKGLSAVPGLFVSEACEIERPNVPVRAGRPGVEENLNASCRLFWITLKE